MTISGPPTALTLNGQIVQDLGADLVEARKLREELSEIVQDLVSAGLTHLRDELAEHDRSLARRRFS